jgi:hypothetical protein
MDNSSPSMLKATLISGSVFGLLGGIPYVNCACCAWMMGAGVLAAYLYSNTCKAAGVEFRPGNGAVVGLVSGLFYAIASTIVNSLAQTVSEPPDIDEIVEQMESGGAPPEFVDMMISFLDLMMGPMGILIGFFIALLLAAVLSTIGGLIGGSVFKVEAQPPASPSGGANLEA